MRAAGVIVEQGGKEIITNLPAAVGAHMATGAVSGAFNTVVSGGNLGQNMVTSAVSAGIAKGLGNYIPSVDNDYLDFGIGVVGHGIIGGITGGVSAELYGGKFSEGFKEGVAIGIGGFLFNRMGGVVVGWIRSPDGRMVPVVRDESGKTTIGFPGTYQDPLTAVAQEAVRDAMEVATSPEVKEGLVVGALTAVKIAARTYLGLVGYNVVRALNYMIQYILTPDEAW